MLRILTTRFIRTFANIYFNHF